MSSVSGIAMPSEELDLIRLGAPPPRDSQKHRPASTRIVGSEADAERSLDFCLPPETGLRFQFLKISVSHLDSKVLPFDPFLNILNIYHSSCFSSHTTPVNLGHICGTDRCSGFPPEAGVSRRIIWQTHFFHSKCNNDNSRVSASLSSDSLRGGWEQVSVLTQLLKLVGIWWLGVH